jgi:hypothetical protein
MQVDGFRLHGVGTARTQQEYLERATNRLNAMAAEEQIAAIAGGAVLRVFGRNACTRMLLALTPVGGV